ncbi:glycosyltransferase family 25 protein [Ferruginibacter albus]|uniref:glycosyltransferase family 25 protein n=1 Tax=Ferruginibacter albus TaxID=2875540 RepID=UPI001CC68B97|nr:glycosyltransferase family 25 protein [Ferruginibacter albus]UAY51177.1 glycosyltransferase family 25 protein [Ferruginibacter albus]
MLKEAGIEGVYVVHAKKGYEMQEAHIKKLFAQNKLEFEFVSDGDPSLFTEELLSKYFIPEIKSVLRQGVVSLTLNQIFCYENVVKNKNKYALIFEDDVFFLGDFSKKVTEIANEADHLPPGFIISLENTNLRFPSVWKLKKDKRIYEASISRCAGAYLIDLQGAKNILEYLKTNKCFTVIDLWMNTLITDKVITMYWAHPPFTEQGSHNGLMSATISSNKRTTWRRFQWLSQKFYKMYISRWFK